MFFSMQSLIHDSNVGNNLRELRNRAGLTQEAVAARLQVQDFDISRGSYSHIEMGIQNIPVPVLRALKGIYRASWDEIFDSGPKASGSR